jgi:uncharacterized membrane protein YphA (DoxX/SURF4 family)
MAAVVMLVALRLTIGWHFLYEGVWKFEHTEFSAEPFLTQAKGPAAPLFYAMVHDIYGRQRLKIETDPKSGKSSISGKLYLDVWTALDNQVVRKYNLSNEQKQALEKKHKTYAAALDNYLKENLDDIRAYFGSLDRFEAAESAGNNGAAHQLKRRWDRRMELRKEAGGWLAELDALDESYRQVVWSDVLNKDQRAMGDLPRAWTQADLLNYAVKYSLTAIGLCLLLGFCTRLAALGGAGFLVSVLLTQPPWPTVYPPAPEVVGHALLVDKNFVEMIASLLLATTAVGRWGGLDCFLYHWFGRRVDAYFAQKI